MQPHFENRVKSIKCTKVPILETYKSTHAHNKNIGIKTLSGEEGDPLQHTQIPELYPVTSAPFV